MLAPRKSSAVSASPRFAFVIKGNFAAPDFSGTLTPAGQNPIPSPDPSGNSNPGHPSTLRKAAIEGNPGEVSFRVGFGGCYTTGRLTPPKPDRSFNNTVLPKMRFVLTMALASTLIVGCKKQEENAHLPNLEPKATDQKGVVIRSIDVNIGTEDIGSRGRVGIELNGDRARLIINPYAKNRQYYDIPYSAGLALIEQFEAIQGVSKHLAKASDSLYEESQYIVHHYKYFDTEERHTQDYVSYVYPKKGNISDSDFSDWLAAMQSAKEQAEQAVAPNRSLPHSQKSTSPVRGPED